MASFSAITMGSGPVPASFGFLEPRIASPEPLVSTSAAVVSAAIPWGSNPVISTALTVSRKFFGATPSGMPPFDNAKKRLLQLAHEYPVGFMTLAGLYFQQSGRSPYDVGKQKVYAMTLPWERDLIRVDQLEKDPNFAVEKWSVPYGDAKFMEVVAAIHNGDHGLALEAAICEWAIGVEVNAMMNLLAVAGWKQGEKKEKLMAQARAESPRFFHYCEEDVSNCGVERISPHENPDLYDSLEYVIRSYRVFGSKGRRDVPSSPPARKRPGMMPGTGRATQVHAVPFEARAPDGKGGKLPFALEYPAGHPDAPRIQKRSVEEKGSFGKSTRRKTPSRTRSATPAKKEINPTLDGFESALDYDTRRASKLQQQSNESTQTQTDGNVASHHRPSHNKVPTQIVVFGFTPSTQWAVIDIYEKISHGIICEDYARRPPAELQRYPNTLSSPSVHPRKLTGPEREMARHYAGGECWVRLTCDSAEAADRAVESSPQQVYGHWVYAELYNGSRPETDEPIPIRETDRQKGSVESPKPPRRPSQTLSAAFSHHASNQQRPTSTLPRSFGIPVSTQAIDQRAHDAASLSPSTASSATATGPDHPGLRERPPPHAEQRMSSSLNQNLANASASDADPAMMRYFKDRPRTVLRPATEAFLPQPTWIDRQLQWLRSWGVIPGDFIGNGPPLTDNGDFDWSKASWYWCVWNWIDTRLKTNFCNLKDE